MNQPDLPMHNDDVIDLSYTDAMNVLEARRRDGWRCLILEVRRGGYRATFARESSLRPFRLSPVKVINLLITLVPILLYTASQSPGEMSVTAAINHVHKPAQGAQGSSKESFGTAPGWTFPRGASCQRITSSAPVYTGHRKCPQ